MHRIRHIASVLLLLAPALLPAQTASTADQPAHRTFALVSGTSLNLFGSYPEDDSPLTVYAHAHPGHYLLFWKAGQLYRLDNAKEIADAERLYAPMASLEARQKELSAKMKPYGEQQRALEARQRAAKDDPAEQGRIGQLQGEVGRQQGEIGQLQGEIGRQQGEIGRAFYARAVALIDNCTADNTCRPAASSTATR